MTERVRGLIDRMRRTCALAGETQGRVTRTSRSDLESALRTVGHDLNALASELRGREFSTAYAGTADLDVSLHMDENATPHGEPPFHIPEAEDMLALFKLAAMDGYNAKPISTVDEWVEECKKRMLLLWLAGRRAATPTHAFVTEEELQLLEWLARTYANRAPQSTSTDVGAPKFDALIATLRERLGA